ncbi:acyl-CoA dehydrogenase family protein (plasmid) [Streptomyces sp. AHU1]|uniref:acyl-CoA dehydrogenase family protein n=1 Tax=Streptomyces sp. AHU1 TaxID=3377215 RepID=UPI003877C587
MTQKPFNGSRNFNSDPSRPSFLEELFQGRFRWDLIHPFPEQDAADRAIGDTAVTALGKFLRKYVDPARVEAEGRLPDELLEQARAHGYLSLQLDAALGGLGLSHFNTFRMIEAAAGWCFPFALVMGIENSVGASAFLPVVPEGPLKELLARHQRTGGLSGTADTEPAGAANQQRVTTAEPVEGGTAYLLNGHKIFVGHAPVGSLFSVTASVREGDRVSTRLFFVEANSPGFTHGEWHEFAGVRGFPNGWISLKDVRVPASHQLNEAKDPLARLTPAVARLVIRGRMHMIVAPSLAVAKLCCRWSREFVDRRMVDGRPLRAYEEIKRQVSATLSETFALESVARAALLPEDLGLGRNLAFKQNTAKNIGSVIAWRIADRTLSLLGAEGYETASSKARRGAPALPIEQAMRDVRNMRVSGGVDFMINYWVAARMIISYYYPEPDENTTHTAPDLTGAKLTERNRTHLEAVAAYVRRFGHTCRELARRHPDRAELAEQQRALILLTQITSELLTMSAALSRASQMETAPQDSDGDGQRLADLYCSAARLRLTDLWNQLDEAAFGTEADFAGQSDAWHTTDGPRHLSAGLF